MKRSYLPIDDEELHKSKKIAFVDRNTEPHGYPLVNAYAVGRSAPNDLVQLAQEIQKADSFIHANACNKLQIIAQQIRLLKRSAEAVLQETKTNLTLNHAACNFIKVPGNIYHLYKKSPVQNYFSMLSPEEWVNCPHEHLGSFRLEHDHSWTPIQNIEEKDNELLVINDVLSKSERFLPSLQCTSMEM